MKVKLEQDIYCPPEFLIIELDLETTLAQSQPGTERLEGEDFDW